jgi:hypothetical protein
MRNQDKTITIPKDTYDMLVSWTKKAKEEHIKNHWKNITLDNLIEILETNSLA